MTSSSRRPRRILAAALTGALVPALAATGATAEVAESETAQLIEQKVDTEVLEQIEASGETELWLRFTGAPDWSEAVAADEKEDKGEAAVEAAVAYAEQRRADVVDVLDAAGAEYETFWASATVKVVGDAALIEDLVEFDEVEAVVEAPEYGYIEPVETEDGAPGAEPSDPPQSPAWHLEDIRAPELWAEGIDGEGIVVGSIDSGVQYDHPALVEQYRGNDGDGTFTHDYNFFDAKGECDGEPCDLFGHGTHTMGTMVGDDGQGNEIGVAPGATWMAASAGASPTLGSFLAAGQWITAPTDSRGNNPDPAMAPHVVNNSWSGTAGYDPFFADVIDLWHAAGIIPVFAAGNAGEEGCLTVGSPGVYENVIAVGATDIDGDIAEFSSKGPGMDGYVKPDMAAPGDGIVSSIPGDGYDEMSGTSMAAPHVAGAIALMMSASPRLEGDYRKVYRHLTGTAVPVEDRSCRGNREANNVYGHGVIDAYAATEAAPDGRFGAISGVVTDDSGQALSRARLDFEGPVDRLVYTDAHGAYAFDRIPVGKYEVTVSKFAHEPVTGSVRVKKHGEAVFDAALTALPTRTVEGVVVDGAARGWPLAATVRTFGGEAETATDPETGAFSLTIPVDGEWPLTVEVAYPGYAAVEVDPDDAAVIEMPLRPGCAAPGYGSDLMQEEFESGATPEGWTVVDRGEADGWVFDDPYQYGNQTSGTGGFAQANSDAADPEALVDTDLISPVFDLSAIADPTLAFASFFYDGGAGSAADIAISTDGGATWEQVWYNDEDLEQSDVSVDLSAWADETEVRLKFHYTDNGGWAFWWMIDNVKIGCEPLEGGLVTGRIVDADGNVPSGAVVSDTATSTEALVDRDGRYVLFSEAGPITLLASAEHHGGKEIDVEVVADAVVVADIVLD